MYYSVCGMVHIKDPLLVLIGNLPRDFGLMVGVPELSVDMGI